MTRDKIIEEIVEGYIKDVLTYDLSKHHPRPHERFRFNNAARKAKVKAREVFRNKPKSMHDTQPIDVSNFRPKAPARRAPGIKIPKDYKPKLKSSSARRPGPTVRQQQGRKAVLGAAAAIGAGIAAHKAYKYHKAKKRKEMREDVSTRSRGQIRKGLRVKGTYPSGKRGGNAYFTLIDRTQKSRGKNHSRDVRMAQNIGDRVNRRFRGEFMGGRRAGYRQQVENDLGNFSVAPTAAVDASPIHKEQRDRYWMIKNRKKIKNMVVKEVFDDTYSAGVLARSTNKAKTTALILKAHNLKKMKVKVPQMKIKTPNKSYGSLRRA